MSFIYKDAITNPVPSCGFFSFASFFSSSGMDSSIYIVFLNKASHRNQFLSALENVGIYRQNGFHSSAFGAKENFLLYGLLYFPSVNALSCFKECSSQLSY